MDDGNSRPWTFPRLRRRSRLIAATVALQALVIGGAWLGMSAAAGSDLSARVQQRTKDHTGHVVAQFGSLLRSAVDGAIVPESPAWEAAQDMVESFPLPAGKSLVLLDRQGRLLCHPNLRSQPGLRRVDYGDVPVRLGGEVVPLRALQPRTPTTASADLLSGPVVLAALHEPRLGVTIVATTPLAATAAAAESLLSGTVLWTGVGGLTILMLTAAGSWILVRRYDTMLERLNTHLEGEVRTRTRRGLLIRNGLIFGLAKLADYRDTDTGKHLDRICRYCEILALELAPLHPGVIDRAWIERLKLASSLHDIGKVGIPDAILLKPGALTPEERRIMEQHPLMGGETLAAVRDHLGEDELLTMGIQVALQHHERWDGTGYPFGLASDRISLAARIVALADVYDALTSARVYKKAYPHSEAVRIIGQGRGTQFDPAVVDAFFRAHEKFDQARAVLQPPDGHVERPRLLLAIEQLNEAVGRKAA